QARGCSKPSPARGGGSCATAWPATTTCSPPPRVGGGFGAAKAGAGMLEALPRTRGRELGRCMTGDDHVQPSPAWGEGSEPPRQARGCSKPSPARGGGLGGGPPESARSPCRRFLRSSLANRPCRFLLPRTSPPGRGLAAGGGPGRAVLFQHALGQHHVLGQQAGGLGDGDPRLGAVLVGIGLQQFADRLAQRALEIGSASCRG